MGVDIVAFLALALVVAATPGPDMALVLRNTLSDGRGAGVATVGGVILGVLGWGVVASVGLAAVLAASTLAFTVLKLAGAAYLVYLGITTLRASDGPPVPAGILDHHPGRRRAAFREGVLSASLNPKLGVFFLTLLPQFVTPASPPLASLGLAGLFAVTGLAWLLVFTALVGSLGEVLARPAVRRRRRRITGVVLVGLGVRVALEH